jgi:hypothetical protein
MCNASCQLPQRACGTCVLHVMRRLRKRIVGATTGLRVLALSV